MPPDRPSKGQLEAEITIAIIKFEREHMGRGPSEARTWIIQDLIFARLKGVLTPAEEKLAQDQEGRNLIKQVRTQLIEKSRPWLEAIVQEITGLSVISLHSDISTHTGERMIIFTLTEDLEAQSNR